MKSTMWHWPRKHHLLFLIGLWALVFLALLSYFLDAGVDETPVSSSGSASSSSSLAQHPDTRRLTSIQAITHQHLSIITGSRPEPASPVYTETGADPTPTTTTTTTAEEPSLELNRSPDSAPYSQEAAQQRQSYLDARGLAAWSSFGTENVGSDPVTPDARRQRRRHQNKNWAWVKKVNVGRMTENQGNQGNPGDDSSDPEEYYFAKPASLVQRLWRGRVSAGMLSPRLQRAMKEYLSMNKHRVAFKGQRRTSQSPEELLCQMKNQAVPRTVDGSEQPFSSLGWAHLVPPRALGELYYRQAGQRGFGSCAVVTSAGAILHSGLGQEIDSHDAVLRFNAAPTEGFERDVGSKTTLRVINSQILANPNHRFNTSSLYKNVTLVAWDPAPYAVNLHKWYASPDYDLFSPYEEHRRLHPAQPFYVLHPSYVWDLWDLIQGNTQESIQPNPPSSGFIGILLMMSLCDQVHVYEYIPSLRQTDLCHYHERYYDIACTMGAYHPLLFEKSLIQRINTGPEKDLKRMGRVTLPGFSTVRCDL